MDGQFISTDIRYRELMNSRRRSTSYRKIKSPGGGSARSRSVDVGAIGGAIGPITEEVGGIEGEGAGVRGADGLVDEVFNEPTPGSGGAIGVENSRSGGGEIEPIANISANIEIATLNDGMKGAVVQSEGVKDEDRVDLDKGAVGGVEVPDEGITNVDSVDGGAVGGVEVPIAENIEGGGEETINDVLEEGEIGRSVAIDRDGGEDIYGMGGFDERGGGGAEGGVGGAGVGGDVDSVVEPVHHIPRWKLYEILAHAEGECIVIVV